MSGIEGIGWPIAPRAAGRAAARSRFMVPPDPASSGCAAPAAVVQAAPLASMLTLQELGEETLADREARRHGHEMLTALADVQRALLGGGDERATLQRLTDLVAAVPVATDRRLAAMVAGIVLRIRVELARRQV